MIRAFLSIFLSFGPLLTLGTAYAISKETILIFSDTFYNLLLLGVPMGLLTTNILYINQFPDALSDAITGKNNLVVTLGKKLARWPYFIFLLLAFLSSYSMVSIFSRNLENFRYDIFLIGISLLFLFGLYICVRLFKDYESRELIRCNVNTIVLQALFSLFYIFLFLF